MEYKSISQLKREGLQSLKGRWGLAILVCLITTIITEGISIYGRVSTISHILNKDLLSHFSNVDFLLEEMGTSSIMLKLDFLINLLLGGSITYGLSRFFLNLTRNENPQFENLFSGFKYFGKNFLIQLIIEIFGILWTLVVYIPVIIIGFITIIGSLSSYSDLTDIEQMPWNVGIEMVIIMVVLFIIASIIVELIVLRYALAFYIYNDIKDASVMDCINHSKEMMRGHKYRLLLLNLSFIGWHILSILTLGIGYLWLRPYIFAATASFYNDLKQKSETFLN
ncbi:DUF975 family protein [Clostridium sp.]|jgi:uncharacterized membrane protein|uniref:DUF975 family protein n=1 Tax=Clostridium sp. TaxID=1506 RepID=UPI0039F4BCAB